MVFANVTPVRFASRSLNMGRSRLHPAAGISARRIANSFEFRMRDYSRKNATGHAFPRERSSSQHFPEVTDHVHVVLDNKVEPCHVHAVVRHAGHLLSIRNGTEPTSRCTGPDRVNSVGAFRLAKIEHDVA